MNRTYRFKAVPESCKHCAFWFAERKHAKYATCHLHQELRRHDDSCTGYTTSHDAAAENQRRRQRAINDAKQTRLW